jgi:hypothetical protein
MTATTSGTALARPRIAYFWWLRESHRAARPVHTADTYVCSERNYIPSSTADMWRRGAPRPLR